ncbi:MAG: DUF167 domain-containing protein [Chloroflexota bacterium]|nr:DUF167 domain-containing protein [Chloroflexota bacterium]
MPTITIEVRVQPKASRNRIVTKDGIIKIYVTAAPEKGRANSAVVEMIARRLEVPKRAVSIVSGENSRAKLLAVEGLSEAEARRKLGE